MKPRHKIDATKMGESADGVDVFGLQCSVCGHLGATTDVDEAIDAHAKDVKARAKTVKPRAKVVDLSERCQRFSDQLVLEIERLEGELDDVKSQLDCLTGRGEIVESLLKLKGKALFDEVDGCRIELFEKLNPLMWPECLLWIRRIEPKRDGRALADWVFVDNNTAENELRRLDELRAGLNAMIDGAIKRAKFRKRKGRRMPP